MFLVLVTNPQVRVEQIMQNAMHVCTDLRRQVLTDKAWTVVWSVVWIACRPLSTDDLCLKLHLGASVFCLPIASQCFSPQNQQQVFSSSGNFPNASDLMCSLNATALHSKSVVTVNIKIKAYLLF